MCFHTIQSIQCHWFRRSCAANWADWSPPSPVCASLYFCSGFWCFSTVFSCAVLRRSDTQWSKDRGHKQIPRCNLSGMQEWKCAELQLAFFSTSLYLFFSVSRVLRTQNCGLKCRPTPGQVAEEEADQVSRGGRAELRRWRKANESYGSSSFPLWSREDLVTVSCQLP